MIPRPFHLACIAAFILAPLGSPPALATTVAKRSVPELSRAASSIVRGRVEAIECRRDPSNGEIYTYVTLQSLEPVKGMRGETAVTLRQLGGEWGGLASIVPGMPSFRMGEEVLVFLTARDRAGYPWILGLQQGKYSIVTDANGHRTVRNELDGIRLLPPGGAEPKRAGVSREMHLQALLDEIRGAINDPGKARIDPTGGND